MNSERNAEGEDAIKYTLLSMRFDRTLAVHVNISEQEGSGWGGKWERHITCACTREHELERETPGGRNPPGS